jgi:hypothetical protein
VFTSYAKRWKIRFCDSKENFPEGAGALHLPWSSGDAGLSAGQKPSAGQNPSAGQKKDLDE